MRSERSTGFRSCDDSSPRFVLFLSKAVTLRGTGTCRRRCQAFDMVRGTSKCKEINLTPVTEMNLRTVRSSSGGLLLMGLTLDCSTFRPSQWVKNLLAMQEMKADASLIPGLGRSPGGGQGYPLQYSYLENPMDRGAWRATVHGMAKSWA